MDVLLVIFVVVVVPPPPSFERAMHSWLVGD